MDCMVYGGMSRGKRTSQSGAARCQLPAHGPCAKNANLIGLRMQVCVYACNNPVCLKLPTDAFVGSALLPSVVGSALRLWCEAFTAHTRISAKCHQAFQLSDIKYAASAQQGLQFAVTCAVWDGIRAMHLRTGALLATLGWA